MTAEQIEIFIQQVRVFVENHPDKLTNVINSACYGMKSRIDREIDKRATAETALVLLAEHINKIPKHQRLIVAQAIVDSSCFSGTILSNKMQKYLTKESK